jgi:hypothetical protein
MNLEIRDAIRWRDQMRTGAVAFRNAKRQVADMMRSASAQFVERFAAMKALVAINVFQRLKSITSN